jgi:hypothetical protein
MSSYYLEAERACIAAEYAYFAALGWPMHVVVVSTTQEPKR